jgi:hypothetical protein
MMNVVRRTPPWLLCWFNRIFFLPMILLHTLFNSAFGMLVASVVVYLWCWNSSAVKPLTLGELVLWFSELQVEAQTGIATTVITVVGFVAAFQSANAAWIRQTRITVQLAISDEIEDFFDGVANSIIDAESWAERFLEAVVQSRDKSKDTRFTMQELQRLLDERETFFEARRDLVRRSRDVHRILGRHSTVLMQFSGATQGLQDCADALSEVTATIWFYVPDKLPENWTAADPDRYIDMSKWTQFVSTCGISFNRINGLSGGVRGLLRRPLMTVGLGMFRELERVLKDGTADEAFAAIKVRKIPKP